MWRTTILLVLVLVLVLAACGQADVDVQVVDSSEATALYIEQATQQPNADDFLLFEHEQTGLFFLYPAVWQVREQDGLIIVNGDRLRLVIKHETFMPNPDAAPAAQSPGIDASFSENEAVFLLGDLRPIYVEATVSADTTIQRLYYTSPDVTDPFTVANIKLSIWLEVEAWPPGSASRQLADAVIESMGFYWLTTRPPDDQLAAWQHFNDAEFGLQFKYPPGWVVIRKPDEILVTNGDAQLTLSLSGGPSGLPAGELRKGDPTHIWLNGTAVPRVHLLYEDQIKAVFYGPPVTPIPVGEHTLLISVTGTAAIPYEDLDLSPETLRQMDWIVTTLHS